MLTNSDTTQTQYALKVNGTILPGQWTQRSVAENALLSLPPESQRLAEVVPVNSSGKELLFG